MLIIKLNLFLFVYLEGFYGILCVFICDNYFACLICSYKKKLHLFEILFMWMVIIFIHHTFLTIAVLNMKLLKLPRYGANYWTLVFNRITLIPILIIWLTDINLSLELSKRFF